MKKNINYFFSNKMSNCNICLEDITGRQFQCAQCKSIACEECLWKHCNNIALVPECFGVKCHYRLSNEELYTLNPQKYDQWLNLIKERIYNKAINDSLFSHQNIIDYVILFEQNKKLYAIKTSPTSTDEEKANASKLFKENVKILNSLQSEKTTPTVNPWLIACPTRNCTGLLDTTHKCSICKNTYCKECNCLLDSNHVCKEEDVSSVNEIKSKCKPCPKCHSMIYREEGCRQMWCTNCKHGFDWGNGKILDVTRNFHNPHYADYVRRTHGTQDDIQEAPVINADQCQVLIPLKDVEKKVNGDILNARYEWLTELALERQNVGERINILDNNYEHCIRNLSITNRVNNLVNNGQQDTSGSSISVEFKNNIAKQVLFHNHQKKCYEYDYEQLITTILSIGIGLINTATSEEIDATLRELDNLSKCFEDRMAQLKILYEIK